MSAGTGEAPLLRDAVAEDLEAMRAIYAEQVLTGTASFELVPPEAAEFARRWAAVRDAGLPWTVAELAGSVAGYAYAGPYRPRPAYRFTVEDSVYVAPAFQGRGLGRALLAATIERATAAGCRQMVAVVGDSGNRGSVALHEALGFRRVGTFQNVGFKFGRWLDTVLLQRELGPGAQLPPEEAMPRAAP